MLLRSAILALSNRLSQLYGQSLEHRRDRQAVYVCLEKLVPHKAARILLNPQRSDSSTQPPKLLQATA